MKNRVKERIIKANLPMWLNGYPLDEMIIEDILNNHGRVIIFDNKVVAIDVGGNDSGNEFSKIEIKENPPSETGDFLLRFMLQQLFCL